MTDRIHQSHYYHPGSNPEPRILFDAALNAATKVLLEDEDYSTAVKAASEIYAPAYLHASLSRAEGLYAYAYNAVDDVYGIYTYAQLDPEEYDYTDLGCTAMFATMDAATQNNKYID